MAGTVRSKSSKQLRIAMLAGIAVPIAFFSISATAQEQASRSAAVASEDAPVIGDIIVTATRKAQSLSRVPASIVAKGQEELDMQGVRSAADIAQITPGISFGQTSSLYGTGQTTIAIRGVNSTSGIPTTGIYIDDTPVQTRVGVSPSLSNPYPQVFDLDRVEVLRGPQGTLFGSGSMGGALRFIMPKPSYDSLSLYGRTEFAATKNGSESYEAGLAVGAPIVTDKVGLRASAWYRHDGGYIDRLDRMTKILSQKDINSSDSFSTRLAIGLKPTENLTITPSLYYQYQDIRDGSRFELSESNLSTGNQRLSSNKIPERHKDRFYLPALKMELGLGDVTLVSDTSYFYRKTRTQSDDSTLELALFGGVTGSFPPGFENYMPGTASKTKQTAFTQEFRLQNDNVNDRFNWIVGAFYQRSFVRDQYAGRDERVLEAINLGQANIGDPLSASVVDYFGVDLYQNQYIVFQRNTHRDEQIAGYAQADYEIVPRLKLTLGGRYAIAKYRFEGFTAGPLYTTDGQLDTLRATSRSFTPRIGASFQADRNNMLYVSAAKGVRGSGVAPPVGSTCTEDGANIGFDPNATLTVKPDSIWSYEAGSKNRLFGGKVSIDASAYHIDWKNVQTLLPLPICTLYTTLNLGNAKIDGFDLAFAVRPTEALMLGVSVAYTNARYTSSVPGPNNTIARKSGEPLGAAPWALQLNAQYTQPVGSGEVYARADFSYSSHNTKPLDLNSPLVDPDLSRAPATSQLDLRAGGRFSAGGKTDLDLSLFVNNVTNEQPLIGLYHDVPGSPFYRAGSFRPRTIGLTLSMRH
ncbi:MAG: TonB-dependent receptor [Sphingobium sp.]